MLDMSGGQEDLFSTLQAMAAAGGFTDEAAEHEPERPSKSNKRSHEDDDEDDKSEAKKIYLKEGADDTEVDLSQYSPKEQERIKMQVLVSNFSEEQLNRYEVFRRATFPKASIKRLMSSVTNATINQNVVITMSGIAKVFVGDIVECALDTMEEWGETGPIQPKHLREAYRRIKAKGEIPCTKVKRFLI